jgi:hypothetical protein
MFALPVGPFKHAGNKVALRRDYPPAYRTYPGIFIIRGITEGAAEKVAHFFDDISRLYAPLKYNAFYPLPPFQRGTADGTGSKGTGFGGSAFSPGPPFFIPPCFLLPVFLPGNPPAEKRTPRHKGQNEIRKKNPKKEKKGIQKNQFVPWVRV